MAWPGVLLQKKQGLDSRLKVRAKSGSASCPLPPQPRAPEVGGTGVADCLGVERTALPGGVHQGQDRAGRTAFHLLHLPLLDSLKTRSVDSGKRKVQEEEGD